MIESNWRHFTNFIKTIMITFYWLKFLSQDGIFRQIMLLDRRDVNNEPLVFA